MSTTKKTESAVVRIPQDMNKRLTQLAKRSGRSKVYYLKEAISSYLEDMEDFILAEAATEKTKKRVKYADLAKELGLAR